MPLSSSSTYAEIVAAYDDNASYAEENSLTKARAFETACRMLLRRQFKRVQHGTNETERDPRLLQDELRRVGAWISGNASAGGVRTLGVGECFRG